VLVGASKDLVEIEEEEHGAFYQSIQLRNTKDGTVWTLINVYGPVQDEKKTDFLQELLDKIKRTQIPLIIGGDFNLVRRTKDKSSGNVDHHFMNTFN